VIKKYPALNNSKSRCLYCFYPIVRSLLRGPCRRVRNDQNGKTR